MTYSFILFSFRFSTFLCVFRTKFYLFEVCANILWFLFLCRWMNKKRKWATGFWIDINVVDHRENIKTLKTTSFYRDSNIHRHSEEGLTGQDKRKDLWILKKRYLLNVVQLFKYSNICEVKIHEFVKEKKKEKECPKSFPFSICVSI